MARSAAPNRIRGVPCRRNIRLRAVQPHIALALLLGIVERMRVQEGPDKLPAHVFEPEFEVRVLVNGMMPAEIRSRADRHALLFGDFLGADQARRIAGARRRDRRIERMREELRNVTRGAAVST